MTANSEYNSHSMGASTSPIVSRPSLTRPFLPSNGIHEIIRITFDVQKGIVHSKNSAICRAIDWTQKARKSAIKNPTMSVITQVMNTNLIVDK